MCPETIDGSCFTYDVLEFIRLLHKHQVKYMVIGGEAVIFHGHARLTGDIDFFYHHGEANVRRLYAALDEFWRGNIPGIRSFLELAVKGMILQFGVPPNRIDLLNTVDGVEFEEAWTARVVVDVVSGSSVIPMAYMGLDELITNKLASGRPKDIDDLRFLKATRDNSRR